MKQTHPSLSTASPIEDEHKPSDQLLQDVIVQTPARPVHADGIAVGKFDDIDDDGAALVSIPAFNLSRVRARTISPLDPGQIGQAVALGFESGNPLQPIILGLMLAAPAQAGPAQSAQAADVVVDGERVVLSAAHEIELRCGEAAIILSADGHIQLRGTYITSQASATQRILGGSVNVN